MIARLAKFEAKAAETGPALEHIDAAFRYAGQNGTVRFQAAVVYAWLGRDERALQELAAAIKQHYSIEDIRQAPELAKLRGNPGYPLLFSRPAPRP